MKFTWYSNCFPIVVRFFLVSDGKTIVLLYTCSKSIDSIYVFLRGTVIVSFLLMLVLREARENVFVCYLSRARLIFVLLVLIRSHYTI